MDNNNRLKTEEYLFDMNAYRFKDEVQSRFRIMFSITLGWFYGSIAILVIIYSVFLSLQQFPVNLKKLRLLHFVRNDKIILRKLLLRGAR